MDTYHIIVLLLAECEVELRILVVGLLELRLEHDHDSVLQEVVELRGVGMESLTFEIVDPKGG